MVTNYISIWDASSHKFPDELCPPWTLYNTANPEIPEFQGDTLVIITSNFQEHMRYHFAEPLLYIPDTLKMEFRMKYVSGYTNPQYPTYAPCMVWFYSSPTIANMFWISQDRVYLWSPGGLIGPQAYVDTDDEFHTYSINVASTGAISVYYDGSPLLTSSTYYETSWLNIGVIGWGEGTDQSYATTKWLSFKHNGFIMTQDTDTDSIYDLCDNCPFVYNPGQED